MSESRMVALGFGKFARADRIFALERIIGEERGMASAREFGPMASLIP
jgi:hypothetical protein